MQPLAKRFILTLGLVAVLFLTAVICRAESVDNNLPVTPQNDDGDPPFPVQLQALVNFFGFHEVNDFCVVAYKSAPDQPIVFWPTQDIFIHDGLGSSNILKTTDYWDIKQETAPAGGILDMGLLRRSLVEQEVQGCWAHGKTYIIRKTVAGWVSIKKYREFNTIAAQLQYIVDNDGTKKSNSFCVIGQKDSAYLAAIVIWKTQGRLYVWLPGKFDDVDPFSVEVAPVQIDLSHGLRSQEDSNEYRNEMQRSYAVDILEACNRVGERFIVTKANSGQNRQ